jgi:hypothetical protein
MKATALMTAAILAMLAAPLCAAEPTATVIDYGRYSAEVTGFRPSAGTSGSVVVQSTNTKHIETTHRVPARLGEIFGVHYELSNLPTDRDVEIRSVMNHPPIRQPDGTTMTMSVSTSTVKAGTLEPGQSLIKWSRWYFVKGFEYEIVPGTWKREVFVDGKKVLEMAFEVYKP